MAWGALWDLVREARLPARSFVDRALVAFPQEKDENLASSMLGRALSALERYIPAEQASPLAAAWEQLLLRRADDEVLPYALRKPSFDAFIGSAQTPAGLNTLRAYLDRFDPSFGGLTGPLPRIVEAGNALGVPVEKGRRLPTGGYEVDHGTQVVGVLPDGTAPIVWTQGTGPELLAEDLRTILADGLPTGAP